MGEYFSPVLAQEDWTLEGYYYSHRFGTWYSPEDGFRDHTCFGVGSKLAEHSYVGNKLPDAVCSWLIRKPMRVGWVGDYTPKAAIPRELPAGIVDAMWGDADIGVWFPELPVPDHEVHAGEWLVNLTKEEAIRIPEHVPGEWHVHPLPLLTSTDGAPIFKLPRDQEELVGTWAWDLLAVTDIPAPGYRVLDVEFVEP